MAVDLTFIATIVCSYGGKYDTAYITVEDAEQFANGKINSNAWMNLSDPQKIAAILTATVDIDGAFSWIGSKYFYNQNLEFPRKLTEEIQDAEPDETFYEMITVSQYQTEMKKAVQRACFEQAFWLARNSGVDVHLENQARGITSYSESYGSISENYSYTGSVSKLCSEAKKLLRKYRTLPKLVRG